MNVEDLFNQSNIADPSFFNFRNAVTAASFANSAFGNGIPGQFADRTGA